MVSIEYAWYAIFKKIEYQYDSPNYTYTYPVEWDKNACSTRM